MKDKVEDYDKTGAVYYNECLKHKEPKNDYVGETDRVWRSREYEHKVIDFKTSKRAASINLSDGEEKGGSKNVQTKQPTRTSSRIKNKKGVNYKELNEGKNEPLTEGSTEFSAHVASDTHEKSDLGHRILCTEDNWFKRGVKEAIAIRKIRPTLNLDDGRYHLSAMYDQYIGDHVTLKPPRKGTKDASVTQN